VIPLTLAEIAEIVGGRLQGADPGALVTGLVEFDSRKVEAGGLFLALPGERVDGHDYVAAAIGRGAVAALVTRPVEGPRIEVADGFAALAALANAVVRRLPDTVVIAITGSSGKTSTKDVIAQLLARLGATVAPPGSFNNELGHPYTVLLADTDTRYLVLETSARGIGHIAFLAGIAPPRIGVVLNVGSAHLGEFGSRGSHRRRQGRADRGTAGRGRRGSSGAQCRRPARAPDGHANGRASRHRRCGGRRGPACRRRDVRRPRPRRLHAARRRRQCAGAAASRRRPSGR